MATPPAVDRRTVLRVRVASVVAAALLVGLTPTVRSLASGPDRADEGTDASVQRNLAR